MKQIESIQVNRVAQVPQQAIWLRYQCKKVFRPSDRASREDTSGSKSKSGITIVASIMQRLYQGMMSHFNKRHTSSLMYQPSCNHLNQGEKPYNDWFGILDDKKSLQRLGNASSSRLKVAIWTCPHPKKHCIISWWLMLCPPCWNGATNHMNCLLVVLKRHHPNCYCDVLNGFCIVETTQVLIVIDIVFEVGKSLETPSNVIL